MHSTRTYRCNTHAMKMEKCIRPMVTGIPQEIICDIYRGYRLTETTVAVISGERLVFSGALIAYRPPLIVNKQCLKSANSFDMGRLCFVPRIKA